MSDSRGVENPARDAETGLYNDLFMREMLSRLFKLYDRENAPGVSVFIFALRTEEGCQARAWRPVALALTSGTRGSDIPVHLGGGTFAVFLVGARADTLQSVAERIAGDVRKRREAAGEHAPVIQGGLAMRRQRETLESLLVRGQAAMDEARASGRSQIRAAVEYFPV